MKFKLHDQIYSITYPATVEQVQKLTGPVGFDIETYGTCTVTSKYSPQPGLFPPFSAVRLLQFYSLEEQTVYVIDTYHTKDWYKVFATCPKLVVHNAAFEYSFLRKYVSKKNFDCSLIAAQLVYHAETHQYEKEEWETDEEENTTYIKSNNTLMSVAQRELKYKPDKTHQTDDWSVKELTNSQIMYAALDSVLALRVFLRLYERIKSYKLEPAYKLHLQTSLVCTDMSLYGLCLDEEEHNKFIFDCQTERKRLEDELILCFGDINPRSSAQLSTYVNECYPAMVASWPRTGKGAMSFSTPNLHAYRHMKQFDTLLQYKKVDKLLNAFGTSLKEACIEVNGRHAIHPQFRVGNTRTGRLSCAKPNLQQIPRGTDFRNLFCAQEDNVFVGADFSQIEMRVAGELSGDKVIRQSYTDGIDLHKAIVADLTKKPIDKITKEERQLGKAINFGLLFGMGAKKLKTYAQISYGVTMSDEQADKAYRMFHRKYAGYSAWCTQRRLTSDKTYVTQTVGGKVRKLADGELFTCSVNTPVQGSAAEVAMLALCIASKKLRGKGHLVNMVHDEIIIETRPENREFCKDVLKGAMEKAYNYFFPDATLRDLVEVKHGTRWGDLK